MTRQAPGAVRDAILASFTVKPAKAELTISEIEARVEASLGVAVAGSSVRSYLRLNTPGVFLRTSRGTYRLVR